MAYLVLVVTLLVWSFSFMAAARLRVDLDVGEVLAARFLPVLLGAGAALLWRWPLRLPRQAWLRVAALGVLGVPAYNFFFLVGIKTVPSGTAALIVAINPVFTAVLAWVVLGEPFGRRRALGLHARPSRNPHAPRPVPMDLGLWHWPRSPANRFGS